MKACKSLYFINTVYYFSTPIYQHMHVRILYILALGAIGFTSCTESRNTSSGAPIVLGDPSTIVTETDSQYLRDMVMDYEPVKKVSVAAADSTTTAFTDTAKPAPVQKEAASKTAPAEVSTN